MRTELETLFELLEPPPGGIERMRAKLAERPRPRMGFALATTGVASVAALVALLGVLSAGTGGSRANALLAAPELDRLLGREPRPVPLSVERDGRAVPAEELPSSDSRVRIYRVL